MRKLIILLCCVVLVSMAGCGGNTAPPPTESLTTTVSKLVIPETLPVTTVDPTEKETVSIENQEQASEPTATSPLTTIKSTEEVRHFETINTSEKNSTTQTVEIASSITSQHIEMKTTATEPSKEIVSEPEIIQSEFDINYWITFAEEYAVSVGLTLDSEAVSCWDNPISANDQCIYLERDIKSRLNRYAKDDDITDVWIWAGTTGDNCYDIYIGYA